MLFNSYQFLFLFLPACLLGYFVLGRIGKLAGASWLAACSLFFYAWWDYRYLPLITISIGVNYLAGRRIASFAEWRLRKRGLVTAIAINLVLLGYYKYADFFIASTNQAFGTSVPMLNIVLPIGISFFTFTQIAFLVDVYQGKVAEYRFPYYVLFVTYFPHLIAGPVLHHKEMMPQFDIDRSYRPRLANFQIGFVIFFIGLGKKVLIADSLAGFVAPVFSPGVSPSLFIAWGGLLAYSFQLYFDFSGYSDMAIGLSRMFGVKLPLNFNSPYKAADISDFWRRWHMTLSRFLRDYLYIPLGGSRHGPWRRRLNLLVTMLLGGLWHGAGWTFVVWGGLHGLYLIVNHAWRDAKARFRWGETNRSERLLAIVLTFLCVNVAWVFFRSPDLETALAVIGGMFGANGAALPAAILSRLEVLHPLTDMLSIGSYLGGGATFVANWLWVVAAAFLTFAFPNTQEIMRRYAPALRDARQSDSPGFALFSLRWRPTISWAIACGMLGALGVLSLTRPSEFLYFQF